LRWVFSTSHHEIDQYQRIQSYNLDVVECKGIVYKKLGSKRSKISLILKEGEFIVQVNEIYRLQRTKQKQRKCRIVRRGCPDRRDNLRIAVASSAVTAAIGLLIGPLIITIIDLCPYRSTSGKSRSCHGFDTGRLLLLRLIIIIGVIDDDYLAVTRRPEDVTIEVSEKLSGEFLITRSVNNERRRAAHWGRPRGTALLEHW
jgi:hypothetical protein